MKISGVATVHAPAGRVWTALADPAVLLAAIPGCERLEPAGQGSYHVTARARVASVEGSYTGEVSASRQQEPSSFVLTVNGAGAPGTVSASVQVRLAETADGSTELGYDADAVIGGLIAGVGQRMFCSVARRLADEFVSSLDEALAGRAGADSAGADSAGADTGLVSPAPAPVPDTRLPDIQVPATQLPATQVSAALAPVPDTQVPAAFARGVLVGAAGALVGVALAGLIGRRAG